MLQVKGYNNQCVNFGDGQMSEDKCLDTCQIDASHNRPYFYIFYAQQAQGSYNSDFLNI